MTRDERITKLRKGRWIRYPRAEQILAQLDELLKHPKTHRMPNPLVFGETNNGKTHSSNASCSSICPSSVMIARSRAFPWS
jgi:hypothetical protein